MTDHGKPTIKDVARTAGMSIGTVSRVLNQHPSVTESSRGRVMEAVRALSYEPNLAAQSMRTRSKKAIGFMVNDIANPLFATISRHAETVFHEHGYALLLANSTGKASTEVDLVEQFFRHRTDAMLISLADETNSGLLKALKQVSIPLVVMDREPKGIAVDKVMTDHAQGMRQATEYLIRLGHRRIGLITADHRISPGRARVEGYVAAHKAAGVSVDPQLIRTRSLSAEFGLQEATSLLTAKDRPSALIAGGNQTLVGALRSIRHLGISVPDALSLVSCDNTELTELAGPPITVVWRDLGLVGRTAADLLLQRLSGEESPEPRRILLPTELLVRQSCGPPAA